jgi:CRISPR-associated protein (TIGR02710 family)
MPEDLQALWEAYKQAVRSGGNPQALYQEMVWPALAARWKEAPNVHPRREAFAVSVHTLGTSPEATILAILGTGAERVYVLHTRESASYLERLQKETGKPIYPLEVGKSDVAAIYREVKRILDQHGDVPVALDLTSGTKAMSAGLAAAGFFFRRFYPKARVVYVDNEDYDSELRRPRAGTERLIILQDPHEVLGEVDALFAKELYGRGEFAQAAKYFQKMVGATGDGRWTLYQSLAEMYEAWHALNLPEAHKKGSGLLDRLAQNAWLNHPLNRSRDLLEKQVSLLEAGKAFLEGKDLGHRRGVGAVARTLLHLGEKEHRPLLAALYAYRALELLLQERLYRYGRLADQPNLTPEEEAALRNALSEILDRPPSAVEVPKKLGLLHLIGLLRLLGDPLLAGKPAGELRGLGGVLQARNTSLLIHGFEVPTGRQVGALKGLAKDLLADLDKELGPAVSLEPLPLGF